MNTEKTTDSEILAKLLYMAFVAPQRPSIQIGDVSFNPFCDALELYARTRMRELNEDGPAAAPEPDTPPEPADTHTHSRGQ